MRGKPMEPGGRTPLQLGFVHFLTKWVQYMTSNATTHNPIVHIFDFDTEAKVKELTSYFHSKYTDQSAALKEAKCRIDQTKNKCIRQTRR